jgi:hypothetical protein
VTFMMRPMAWFDVTFGPTATSTVHRSVWRWVLSGAAAASAVAHVPVIEPHLTEAPYMGVLFVVFTAICLVISSAALVRDTTALDRQVLGHRLPGKRQLLGQRGRSGLAVGHEHVKQAAPSRWWRWRLR